MTKPPTKSAALCLLALLAYLPALRGGFLWDDDAFLENRLLDSWRGLADLWLHPNLNIHETHYWPLVYTFFWIARRLWGTAALGYIATNIALHALNGILLWRVLERLRQPAAWLGAALFVVHPINVESVAWCIELKNVANGTFALASVLCWLRAEGSPRSGCYAAAVALHAAGLLVKSSSFGLPLVMIALTWWRHGALTRRDALLLLPFLATSLGHAALDRLVMVQRWQQDLGLSFLQRLLLAAECGWFYLAKLLLPINLMVFYPRWEIPTGDAAPWLALLSWPILAAAAAAARARGPLTCLLCYCFLAGPTTGLIIHSYMRIAWVADRFAYLPAMVVLPGAAGLVSHLVSTTAPRWVLPTLGVAWLAALGAATFHRSTLFADPEALLRDNIERAPESWMAWTNLGMRTHIRGALPDALAAYEESLSLDPHQPRALKNMANVLARLGRADDARRAFRAALAEDPNDATAFVDFGTLEASEGNTGTAISLFEKAVTLAPGLAEAHANLGALHAMAGRHAQAIDELTRAAALAPNDARIAANLARAKGWQQRGS